MFQTSEARANRLYHWILLGVCAFSLAGCRVQPEDEIAACKNLRCTAGTCRLISGTATCVCTPVELVQGVECAVAPSVVPREPEPDDFGNDFATAAELPLGLAVAGRIGETYEGAADLDMFWMATTPGQIYAFTCRSCSVRLLRPDGTVAPLLGRPGEQIIRATEERIFIEVRGGEGIRYSVSGDLVHDDVVDVHEGATTVAEGSRSATFEVLDDQDVFTFDTAADSAYLVAGNVYGSPPIGIAIEKADGTVLTAITGPPNFMLGVRGVGERLFVRFTASAAASYSWHLSRYKRDDYQDDATGTWYGSPLPFSVKGVLEVAEDVDAFKLNVAREHPVTFKCSADFGGRCEVEVVDYFGTTLAANANGMSLPLTAGTWYVNLRGIGPYELKVDWYDDFTASHPAPVPLGTISGEIDFEGDSDIFSVEVQPKHYYRATCTSATGTCSATGLLAHSGAEFRTDRDDTTARISVTGTLGPWEVTTEDLGADDASNGLTTGVALTSIAAIQSGAFEVGWDKDCFRFDYPAGTYTLAQSSGVPAELSFMGAVHQLPYTVTFSPSPDTVDEVCFAPVPVLSQKIHGTAGPYTVAVTTQ